MLTGANAHDDPAKAARRLAAVALHAPGRDWGGDELEGGDELAELDGGDEGGGAEVPRVSRVRNAEGDDSDAEDERGVGKRSEKAVAGESGQTPPAAPRRSSRRGSSPRR